MTLEQIVEATRDWPAEKVGELVGRLSESLHHSDPETEAAWQSDIARRVQEIRSGLTQGIPGDEVTARLRALMAR